MIDKQLHIKGKGLSCPFCGSSSIQGGFIEIETGKAFQKMGCTACEAHWQDVYELIDMIPDINPYSIQEVTNERIPDQAFGLAGLLGQCDRD